MTMLGVCIHIAATFAASTFPLISSVSVPGGSVGASGPRSARGQSLRQSAVGRAIGDVKARGFSFSHDHMETSLDQEDYDVSKLFHETGCAQAIARNGRYRQSESKRLPSHEHVILH